MRRNRKVDDEMAAGLDTEGYVLANTEAAFEALGPREAESPRCVRCGLPIKHVFLTNKGPMGGDCLATLTGDPSTRRLARKLSRKLDEVSHYAEVKGLLLKRTVQGSPAISAVILNRDDYDSWTGRFGTRSRFLLSGKPGTEAVLAGIGAHEAELRGLTLETKL